MLKHVILVVNVMVLMSSDLKFTLSWIAIIGNKLKFKSKSSITNEIIIENLLQCLPYVIITL